MCVRVKLKIKYSDWMWQKELEPENKVPSLEFGSLAGYHRDNKLSLAES